MTQSAEDTRSRDGRRKGGEDETPKPRASAAEAEDEAIDAEAEVVDEDEASSSKKERVLHTRVPAVLERELKRFAESLRVPVSNLVRTILEDAVSVADAATENVENRLKKAATQLEHKREVLKKKVATDPLENVFAFQEVKLAQPARCAKCQRELAKGERAHLGLSDPPPRSAAGRVFVCVACLPTG